MDRRTLLKSVFGGGGVAGLISRDAATYAPRYAEGLRLHWSGWKADPQYRWLVGQWYAWPEPLTPDPMYYYVNVPSMRCGRLYDPSCSVDLTPQGRYVYPETPEVEKNRLIWEGYGRLLDLLRTERG